MTNVRKQQRIAQRAYEAELSRHRRMHSLSGAFLRASAIRGVFERELEALKAELATGAKSVAIPVDRFEATQATRTSACVVFYYASLQAVVEGWGELQKLTPPVTDARIDAHLVARPDLVKILRDFRNYIFTPRRCSIRNSSLFNPRSLKSWSAELCDEFFRFFREWRDASGFSKAIEQCGKRLAE